jgi:hypothetical protein
MEKITAKRTPGAFELTDDKDDIATNVHSLSHTNITPKDGRAAPKSASPMPEEPNTFSIKETPEDIPAASEQYM